MKLADFKHLFAGLDQCGFRNNGGCKWRLFTFTCLLDDISVD